MIIFNGFVSAKIFAYKNKPMTFVKRLKAA